MKGSVEQTWRIRGMRCRRIGGIRGVYVRRIRRIRGTIGRQIWRIRGSVIRSRQRGIGFSAAVSRAKLHGVARTGLGVLFPYGT